ncbi:helix-turn-helix domain-containing protein [Amycolatopsis sp. YIM 10]|uniref:helix-turn-helix domain-containing protein n=1 Tax=Amycolatopsis sp. YIM 10 TaxID=2653857 RepID=UPI00129057D8|nr:helix-turn-helix domain-containing protein [Amycolatopsis sp. YIM 10]QFU90958.1 Helix-turn-helix domain protein [Amycolatopsis sp. YIM 10]
MQVERTRKYRVKTIATGLDVSVATIYRAVESGALRAIRIGVGKGAIRIEGAAVEEYLANCESAAVTRGDTVDDSAGSSEFATGGAA